MSTYNKVIKKHLDGLIDFLLINRVVKNFNPVFVNADEQMRPLSRSHSVINLHELSFTRKNAKTNCNTILVISSLFLHLPNVCRFSCISENAYTNPCCIPMAELRLESAGP